ncbi:MULTISPECIES: nuclear transport factor 2 family protein [unclassified Flavobacterium]|uniref:nuclear transport factor 2 family protein n=1 Tax=unclassified Flavobacterium TaxID=196869 RepID=UPI0026269C91|nr:nuclear transport factor 2 family protein [Flavobacterium sp.]
MNKELVQAFYLANGPLNKSLMETFLHDEIIFNWHSSKGFLQLDKQDLLELATELSKSYIASRIEINHILEDNHKVSLHYTHYVAPIENPNEEIILAHFMVICELKDDKLYKVYQMSQLD